ncbi:MAG: LPS export ABC transporter periplasmic protein LptC [Candidatus Omnitrophica bacterium]|nr:LPS export ABC transporter periplasmic protein LptC [Candidatus Omnitrophota bacterium]
MDTQKMEDENRGQKSGGRAYRSGSNIMRKNILITILVISLITTLWTWWYASRTQEALRQQLASVREEDEKGLEQKVYSFAIDGRSPKGVKQWHLEGNSAEIKGEDIHLNDLKAVAYGDDATVNLTSDKGIYNKEKGEVELIGDVDVVSDAGFTLNTDRARWSQTTKEIYTDAQVHITGKGVTAKGVGGRANSDEKWAILKEQVVVTMEPETRVDCDGPLEVSYKDNTAIFYNNVSVRDKDGKMYSDKLTVNIDPETQKLSQVVAEGNVKVKRGKSYTISEKAIYTDSTKHAQLLGRPRVIIDPEQLTEMENSGGFSGMFAGEGTKASAENTGSTQP